MIGLLAFAVAGVIPTWAAQAPKISVRVVFLEALAPRDTTSSERFQREYEQAIATAKTETAGRLRACGYELDTSTSFYDAGDPLQAREGAERAAREGAWLIVGPRRSNHYLLLAQGAANMPTVSLMASAQEIEALGPLHLSLSPTNSVMAKVAASEAAQVSRRSGRHTYFSVVNEDCVSCVDFAASFDLHAKSVGLRKTGELRVHGDAPDTTEVRSKINEQKPGVVLLPNYSKSAAHVMAALETVRPRPFFVGGDGWGDSKYGFVQHGERVDTAVGITIRGLPPVEEGMKSFPLGRKLLATTGEGKTVPWSGPGLAILRLIDRTTDLLCQQKPRDRARFTEAFGKNGKSTYSAPWGVSVFKLEKGNLTYRGKGKAG